METAVHPASVLKPGELRFQAEKGRRNKKTGSLDLKVSGEVAQIGLEPMTLRV